MNMSFTLLYIVVKSLSLVQLCQPLVSEGALLLKTSCLLLQDVDPVVDLLAFQEAINLDIFVQLQSFGIGIKLQCKKILYGLNQSLTREVKSIGYTVSPRPQAHPSRIH